MAVSARDVARVAGVSVSTVSRALTRPDDLAPETLAKVLETARAMGYHPNPAARGLTTGRTSTIGLIVPDLENPFFSAITKGAQARARAAGYGVMIADSDEDPSQEADLIREMARQVDGLLLCSPRSPDEALTDLAQLAPLVLVNRQCGSLPAVLIDNMGGVRLALEHLRALGHRTIAYVGGPATSWSSRERLAAAQTIAAQYPDTELLDLGSFQPYVAGGIAAGDLLIASGASAALAYNDLVAFGLLDRLKQRGVLVPEDISVVGVDNIPMSALSSPALTSAGIPQVNCGRAGADMLVALLRRPDAPPTHHHDLSFQLVVRESTAPYNAHARLRTAAQPA